RKIGFWKSKHCPARPTARPSCIADLSAPLGTPGTSCTMDWDAASTATDGYICPPCPVFYPTAEEFRHPLKYISSIRHIGMQAGICKIVPPKGWQPPFAINEKTFRFRTRVQQLNCIEGHTRAEGNFVEALRMFLYRHGTPMQELPRVDGQLLNLQSLYKTVVELGGYDHVCAEELWAQVVRRVGRTAASQEPSATLCTEYQRQYQVNLLPFERHEHQQNNLRTPEIKKEKTELFGDIPTASSTASNTPQTKTRSSMKKSTRQRPAQEPDDSSEDSPNSKRVKRTLFSEAGHTSSEENDTDGRSDVLSPMTDTANDDGNTPERDSTPPTSLEPEALKPDPTRRCKIPHPTVHVGQKFYQFFPQWGVLLAEVKRLIGGKNPHHVQIRYEKDGSMEKVEYATAQLLIANGWDASAAELAFKSEICQSCLRGDCWDQMLLCDSCNAGHHIFCLSKQLDSVPIGDWYCETCVADAIESKKDNNPKFGFEMGSEYNVTGYKEKADAWKRSYFGMSSDEEVAKLTDKDLEREYWRLLSIPLHEQRIEAEYGSDIDSGANGSGFPRHDMYQRGVRFISRRWKALAAQAGVDPNSNDMLSMFSAGIRVAQQMGIKMDDMLAKYANDDWNLNNLPKLSGSVLQHLDEDIKGVMVPWIYMGMCFSTFCWHVEDHNFYSVSYLHCGSPKTWYGIPCAKAGLFEETMRKLTPELFGGQPDLHLQLVTMFSPETLLKHNVPVYRATHRPNEFMVTFPSAYHGGFNNGFNCAEAVNFATLDWLPWGAQSVRNYRKFSKLPVFAHEALVLTLAETVVETNSFEYESTKAHLLPALKQLLDEYRAFEKAVKGHGLEKREVLSSFAARTHMNMGPTEAGATTMRSSKHERACKMTTTTLAKKPRSAASKMKMSAASAIRMSKMMAGEPNTMTQRPTRMVLWAGRSGKNEGLRCVTCKQYCYLQAVVCTRCKHHSSVGCIEHFPDMCRCKSTQYYTYVYRHEESYLRSLIQSIELKLKRVEEWNKGYDASFAVKLNSEKQDKKDKLPLKVVKELHATALDCGGVDSSRMELLSSILDKEAAWNARISDILARQKEGTEPRLADIAQLQKEAMEMMVTPAKFRILQTLLSDGDQCLASARKLVDVVRGTQNKERYQHFDLEQFHPKHLEMTLLEDNKRHHQAIEAIVAAMTNMELLGFVSTSEFQNLSVAKEFLHLLVRVNEMLAPIAGRRLEYSVSSISCRRLLDEADRVAHKHNFVIFKTNILRALLNSADYEEATIRQVLTDGKYRTASDLEALYHRVNALPVQPNGLDALALQLSQCRDWETRAQSILNRMYGPLAMRPLYEDVLRLEDEATEANIPMASPSRRELRARIEDCQRWSAAAEALFVPPSDRTTLSELLTELLDKFHSYRKKEVHPHTRVHCVCQQVLSYHANTIACQQCRSLFHERCVGYEANGAPFVCQNCETRSKYGRGNAMPQTVTLEAAAAAVAMARTNPTQLFCVCRDSTEDRPMICCDYCDEWYHADCINLSVDTMNTMEAFRCRRCAIIQKVYYIDGHALRNDYESNRPSLTQVEALISQLPSLISFPTGARELCEYVQLTKRVESDVMAFVNNFASEFSAATFTQLNFAQEEKQLLKLMLQVTDLEISLDAVQGSLAAVHWCLRACHMVLDCDQAPKYSHLVVLLSDVDQPNFMFPRREYHDIHAVIRDRVGNAGRWLKQVKTLEVEEWNVEKAKRLLREYQELCQFLHLPEPEVELVHRIANVASARSRRPHRHG
ncbi:TPA: hypothetical protein N0F65_002743, partial [Lagenidium giganteum]